MYWMQFEILLFALAWKLGLHMVTIAHFLEISTSSLPKHLLLGP
jgi:hypothetical protein